MVRIIQNDFSAGEISPVLYGRSDLQAYYKACADAENLVVSKEGTLRKRHGITSMMAVDGVSDWSDCRVFPYKYDRTMGGFAVLVRDQSGISLSLYDKVSAERRGGDVRIYSGTSDSSWMADMQCKQIGDQLWITNGRLFRIVTVNDYAGTCTLSVDVWRQSDRPSAGSVRAEWNGSTTPSKRTVGYALYVVKGGVFSRRSEFNIECPKTWPAGAFAEVTCTFPQDRDYAVLCKSQGGSYGEIARWYPEDASASATFHDENILPGDAVFSQTNVLGDGFSEPLCVDCFQQRKVFANAANGKTKKTSVANKSVIMVPEDMHAVLRVYRSATNVDVEYSIVGSEIVLGSVGSYTLEYVVSGTFARYPMTMWFSEIGNLDNFFANRPSDDSDAFSPTISSTGPAFIRWICTYQDMIVLMTDAGMFSVGSSETQGFSSSTCRISKFSGIAASSRVQPIVTDAGIVFVAADEKTVYTASFDLQENAMKPVNRSVLAEHLTRGSRITAIGLQEFPNNVVWASTGDGRLLTFTFEKNEGVYAWSHSRVSGANVVDLVSIGTVTDFDSDRTYGDMVFVLEKDGVFYIARFNDGYEDVVGGGGTNVVASMTTLRAESQDRTVCGVSKNVKDVLLRLYETTGFSVMARDGKLVPVGRVFGEPFSGDVKIMPRGFQNDNGQITIVSDTDGPCEILEIVSNVEVSQ